MIESEPMTWYDEKLEQDRNDILVELRRLDVNLSHFVLTQRGRSWILTSNCDERPRWKTASIFDSPREAAERLVKIARKCCPRGMMPEIEWERSLSDIERAANGRRRVTRTQRVQVMARDAMICGICGLPVAPGDVEIDHVIPRARGGDDHTMNLQVAHYACNRRKGTTMWGDQSDAHEVGRV